MFNAILTSYLWGVLGACEATKVLSAACLVLATLIRENGRRLVLPRDSRFHYGRSLICDGHRNRHVY